MSPYTIFLAVAGLLAAEVDFYDQSKVALEAEPPRPGMTKIVLVAGRASHAPGHHEYFAGLALLAEALGQTKDVHPVLVRDGWPSKLAVFAGARSIVFYADGGDAHPLLQPGRLEAFGKLMAAGTGLVALHYAVNFPARVAPVIQPWLGGIFDIDVSSCPACTWTAAFQHPPAHPIARGVPAFTIRDEWYFNIQFAQGLGRLTPILQAVPPAWARTSADARKHPGRAEVTTWAFERPAGGRSFGHTGGHYHDNWGEENVRRVIVNGILWTAGLVVPEGGARGAVPKSSLSRNLDDKHRHGAAR